MYFVAYEYTDKAGAYAGSRFWTGFPSKEHFEESEKQNPSDKMKVVGQGEDAEEVQRIAMSYDPTLHFRIAQSKIDQRINDALKSFDDTGDKSQLSEDMRNITEYGKMLALTASIAASAQIES